MRRPEWEGRSAVVVETQPTEKGWANWPGIPDHNSAAFFCGIALGLIICLLLRKWGC